MLQLLLILQRLLVIGLPFLFDLAEIVESVVLLIFLSEWGFTQWMRG